MSQAILATTLRDAVILFLYFSTLIQSRMPYAFIRMLSSKKTKSLASR